MTAYRRAPKRAGPVRVRMTSWWELGITAAILVALGSFACAFSLGVEISCTRAEGACVVTRNIGPGFDVSRLVLPTESVYFFELRDHPEDRKRLKALAVVQKDSSAPDGARSMPIDAYTSAGWSERAALAKGVNQYLSDPSHETFIGSASTRWPFIAWVVVASAGIAAALIRLRTAIVVDHEAGVVTLERGMRREPILIELDSVLRAELQIREHDDGNVTGVALVRRDGSVVDVTGFYSHGEGEKKRIHAALKQALERDA